MNLYDGIERIRYFFRVPAKGAHPSANSGYDSHALATLARNCFLRARNGHMYFYSFPIREEYADVVRYLLGRNGMRSMRHMSRYKCYHDERRMSFRVPYSCFDGNPALKSFADSTINVDQYADYTLAQSFYDNIRNQMRQKSK